jgi:hypothetical protein
MKKLYEGGEVSHLMYVISQGPNHQARVFNGCVTNVFLFRAPDIEKNLTTQNNDVLVKGDDSTSNMDWYGVCRKIISLQFASEKKPFYLSVIGTLYLLPIRTKVDATGRISMGLSVFTQIAFDI